MNAMTEEFAFEVVRRVYLLTTRKIRHADGLRNKPVTANSGVEFAPREWRCFRAAPAPVSIIVGSNGELLGDPVVGSEGMVVADIDIARSCEHKMAYDIVGLKLQRWVETAAYPARAQTLLL